MIAVASPAAAEDGWSLEAALGGAYNLPTPLTVRQEGFERLRFRARYETRAFELPLYYAVRITRGNMARAWAVELIHHKLHLIDEPPEIQSFAVSHGYNLVTVSRVWRDGRLHYGAGAGVVLADPENTVRGRALPEKRGIFRAGYYVAGPTAAAFIGRRLLAGRGWFVFAEARGSASYARLPVRDGNADVPNLALHGLLGLGRELRRRPS